MSIFFRTAGPGALTFAAALALASAASSQAPAAPSRINAGETVNVEVKIVPFYAVDAQGNPVYDLRPDEVELRVGGAPVAIESFDRYAIQSGRAGSEAPPAMPTPTPSRNVFFLFDRTFSSPTGLNTDKRLAARMVETWPGGDRLFLMAHGTAAGIEKKLGPVPPDAAGKKELLAAIEALEPETRRLELQENTRDDYGPASGRASRSKITGLEDQRASLDDTIRGLTHSEYHSIARDFASSLADFAAGLHRIAGPKLLVIFSQGVDNTLYFEGDSGLKVASNGSAEVDSRRAPPLLDRFRQPLVALAESGTVLLFVNTDRGQLTDADAVLRHMAQTSGGLYIEGRDPRDLEKRIAGSTTAYYEAGFHPAASLLQKDTAAVEVVVRRPGVRVWAPAAVRTRESYLDLSAAEKQRLVVDLLAGGPAVQQSHSTVRLNVKTLPGRVTGQTASGHPALRFEAAWPAELAARQLDVYNVLFAPPAKGKKGKILRFDARDAVASADRATLETVLEGEGALVWGIVAVDPGTQEAWFCRLGLRGPGEVAKK